MPEFQSVCKVEELLEGEGRTVEIGGKLIAVFLDQGQYFAIDNVCPHMGCKVHWNSVETSWDCPCHGSRFRPDGTVIEGPALGPLARKHLPLA